MVKLIAIVTLLTAISYIPSSLTGGDIFVDVECEDYVEVGSLFEVTYIVDYQGEQKEGLDLTISYEKNDAVEFVGQQHAAERCLYSMDDSDTIERWTTTWKAVGEGRFVTPAYTLTMPDKNDTGKVDTLDVISAVPRRTIFIEKTDTAKIQAIIKLVGGKVYYYDEMPLYLVEDCHYFPVDEKCPECGGDMMSAVFATPDEYWEKKCGRQGIMSVCTRCGNFGKFHILVKNWR